jgi:RNA polymerase sigma factor (sigma-70 family)
LPPNGARDMASDQPSVLRHLRRAALLADGGGMTDGQLLECFVARRDEAAFEALVRRHGSMVLGVCRRVLRHPQDAEDAFQAAFLVLARKAASIRRRELLGNWLYGVAYRTALDARAAAARRRAHERQVSAMPEPEARDSADVGDDLRPLLDQELHRLPNRYRVPVVLCDLEGRTRREAARQLGVPEGTLSGRLTTARRILARRLARRGVSLSAGALAAALSQCAASACVPSPLVASTVKAAAGGAAAAVVSARVVVLAEGVVKTMFATRLKSTIALLLMVGVIFGAGLVAHQPGATEQPPETPWKAPDGKEPAGPRVLKLDERGRRVVWSPDGKTLVVVTKVEKTFLGIQYDREGSAIRLWDVEKGKVRQTLAEGGGSGLGFQQVAYSADGQTIAAAVFDVIRKPDAIVFRSMVQLWDARTAALKRTLSEDDTDLVCVALSPDGKRVAAGDPARKVVRLWDAGTGKLERSLDTGAVQAWSVAFSPDGKSLLVGGQKADHSGEATLWDIETGKVKQALKTPQWVSQAVFAPTGKLVAVGGGSGTIALWDVEKGKLLHSLKGHERGTRSVAFSPDGKTLAAAGPDGKVRLWDVPSGKLRETLQGHEAEVHSVAFSADGRWLASTGQDQTVRLWRMGKRDAESR